MPAPVISPALLGLLRCPLTMQTLRVATAEELARFPDAPEAALIREDGSAIFPIRDGLPVLLPDALILPALARE